MSEHRPSPEARDINSFDYWLDTEAKKQYMDQVKTLNRIGLLDILPEAEAKGVVGIDGKEYPVPSWADIKKEMESDKEKYDTKRQQGFVKLQITPFALPLERLTTTLEKKILEHHQAGTLLATKDNPTDPDEALELDANQPLYTWNGWLDKDAPAGERGTDVTGQCVYYPESFDRENHHGQTKQAILDKQTKNNSPFAGWNVLLLEASPNIPREGKGKTIGNRKQLEANTEAREYLKTLQTNPTYQHEQGLTNEDWLTQFLTHLESTNQVIDDYDGKGSACFLAGTYNPASGNLGDACWIRDYRRAYLHGRDPGRRNGSDGFRSAVGVGA